MIDDVHFISSKKHTQIELLHTFDTLEGAGHQIVMASDSPPHDIRNFTDALRTRFLSGMVVELKAPSKRVRMDILQMRLHRHIGRFPKSVLQMVVDMCSSNVRELEGAVNTLMACAALSEGMVPLSLAKQALSAIQGRRHRTKPPLKRITQTVCNFFNLTSAELNGAARNRRVSYPRQIAMYLVRDLTGAAYKEIGDKVGHKNHTTAMAACRKIENLIGEDKAVKKEIETLIARIRSEGQN